MGLVGLGLDRVILFYYFSCSDLNLTHLISRQKILTHTQTV
jgi:hypothetical protein